MYKGPEVSRDLGSFRAAAPWERPLGAWRGRVLPSSQLQLVFPGKSGYGTIMNSIQISRWSGPLSQTFQ